jgi:heme a synthase
MTSTIESNNKHIAIWLFIVAIFIYGMIILGGVTRLTQSGLSMVKWQPIEGIIPPITEAEWQAEFEHYKQYPEYKKKHINIDLAGFKSIFYFEYSHRVLGRSIGLLFLLPFLYFYFRKKIPAGLTPKLLIMFVLGGLQGVLGWYMVKSGLVNDPHVSQYRLTAHLSAALVIYIYILWVAFSLIMPKPIESANFNQSFSKASKALIGMLLLLIMSGGLVAGTRAGYLFPTWPLMGESFIPEMIYTMKPWWMSMFEDPITIQLNHRLFAYVMFFLISAFAIIGLRKAPSKPLKIGFIGLIVALLLQVTLGISTLLMHVPVSIAAAHQGGAVILLTVLLYVSYRLKGST